MRIELGEAARAMDARWAGVEAAGAAGSCTRTMQARWAGAEASGAVESYSPTLEAGARGAEASGAVESYSADSRTLAAGALFFALKGPNHDGHGHVAAAFERGAAAAVVEREVEGAGPQLVVEDTLAALQALARWARRKWGGTVIGVTGSAGKSTAKEAIAAIVGAARRTGKTSGNYNNHVGVPLTLLHLPDDAEIAVVEIGMNHAGEIRDLCGIARPEIGVATNAGTAHIENFADGAAGVARAKRELIEALPADGVAVLNADDAAVSSFASAHPGRVVKFGIEARDADVRAEAIEDTENGVRFTLAGAGRVEVPVPGRAGVMAALAGFAAARALGLDPAALLDAPAAMTPLPMRAEKRLHRGVRIWNDCYNSNPEAVRLMLEMLAGTPAERHIAALGEMLELGRWSKELHEAVGQFAASCGISVLVGIRGAARHLVDAARQAGLAADAAYFFEAPQDAGRFLRAFARPGDAILFKGSRGTRVELALEEFLAEV